VMNEGRIEQAAPARAVFDWPGTVFVARFIGGHNVLRCNVEAADAKGARLRGPRGIAIATLRPGLEAGSVVHVAIRSDRMHIKRAGKRLKAVGSGNSLVFSREALESRVAAVEYQGAIVKLRLEADWGDELTVTLADQSFYTAPLAEGDVIELGHTLFLLRLALPTPLGTAASFDADGFFLTGDLGLIDADGRVRFRGRIKEMVKTGGINVAPIEVEEVLLAHPAVQLAFVVGVPDAARDEILAAAVVLKQPGAADAEALLAHCRTRLAAYKLPRLFKFVAESDLPLTVTGKIQKNRIAAVIFSPPA